MAKSLDELVRDHIGSLTLANLQQQVQIEALTEKVAALTLPASPPVADAPEGDT